MIGAHVSSCSVPVLHVPGGGASVSDVYVVETVRDLTVVPSSSLSRTQNGNQSQNAFQNMLNSKVFLIIKSVAKPSF